MYRLTLIASIAAILNNIMVH